MTVKYILDSSVLIAFYTEAKMPRIIEGLSKYIELVIPYGVMEELKDGSTWSSMDNSINLYKIVKIEEIPQDLEEYRIKLGKGELEVLSIAYSYDNAVACIDDKEARKVADEKNIPKRGTLGIARDAIKYEIISCEESLIFCKRLIAVGFRFKGSCEDIFNC